LRIAQGEPLPLSQEQVRFEGHAIEVRLCAEDEHFTPHSGPVLHFREPLGARFDHAIFEGLQVSPHYDSMLGKLIAHAPTRAEAITRLASALDCTEVLGLPTNRRFLAACLRHPEFQAGNALIPFLDRHAPEMREALAADEQTVAVECGLAALWGSAPGPRQLACSFPRPVRLRHRDHVISLQVRENADGSVDVMQDGQARRVTVPEAACVRRGDSAWHVQHGAVDLVVADASFEPALAGAGAAANELRAPFNGKVIAINAQPGATVARGDTLLVLESMKLEHALGASRDGVVKSVHVEPGQQAATSQVLVTFEALQ
jgi:3-methylcrotonyl-CoA carboxylase alpha subunit/geranyl-CoA carboxylase alpha subunit